MEKPVHTFSEATHNLYQYISDYITKQSSKTKIGYHYILMYIAKDTPTHTKCKFFVFLLHFGH